MISLILLAAVPVSAALRWFGAPSLLVFAVGALAITVLANWTRRATEQIADRAGGAVGGLVNVSFGSIAELVLALFVLTSGQQTVVQAQITGSIIGTSLLGLGLAMLVGGIGRQSQHFDRASTGLLSTMLFLVVIALILPAVFDTTQRSLAPASVVAVTDEQLSLAASAVLLLLYGANLVYTLVTHRDVFARGEGQASPDWSLGRALLVLVASTAAIAFESELVSSALGEAAAVVGLSPVFVGVVVLALVGTAGDLIAAVAFARQGRMSVVFSICVGSSIQMALVVAPLLVLISWLMGHPMSLVLGNALDLVAITSTALVVRAVTADGETTWFEGLLLTGVYVLFALAFFFLRSG
jgi:Ca2+:H+ antiporter